MAVMADPTLFHAHALHTDETEPHVQPGNHIRLAHHPALGLPVTPFLIFRAEVRDREQLPTRHEVLFRRDADGAPLQPPVDLAKEGPVTATILVAAGETCVWAELFVERADDEREREPVRVPRRQPVPPPGLTAEAFLQSESGLATIGRRSAAPWAFSGPGLRALRLTGSRVVTGLRWIEGTKPPSLTYEAFAVVGLPHPGGRRYLAVPQMLERAKVRVQAQAPKRRPLQDGDDVPDPESARPATPDDELERVATLTRSLAEDLDQAITAATPLFEQLVEMNVADQSGQSIGRAQLPRLHAILQMQADPGTASHLGYMIRDADARTDDMLTFYEVHGFFADPTGRLGRRNPLGLVIGSALGPLGRKARGLTADDVRQQYSGNVETFGLTERPLPRQELQADSYVRITTICVADRGAPLDPVEAVLLSPPRHVDWLPLAATAGGSADDTVPGETRHVETLVRGARVAGLLAAQRRQPLTRGGSWTPLNSTVGETAAGHLVRLPLLLGLDSATGHDAPPDGPGTGFIADEAAGPAPLRVHVAQQDRFGRWSAWTAAQGPAGPRPKPPRPEFQAYYTPPTPHQMAGHGGTVVVHVDVPSATALAPGSLPLERVQLRAEDGSFLRVPQGAIDDARRLDDNGRRVVEISLIGPVLPRGGQRRLTLTAWWLDSAGQESAPSLPQRLRLSDPRPPPQLPGPAHDLAYTARPDATGLAWVEHRWTPQPGQAGFAAYYADEHRLRAHLAEDPATAAEAAAFDAADDPAEQAAILRANEAAFPARLFERLEGVLHTLPNGDTAMRHALSGANRLLNAYRFAAESASGVPPTFSALPLHIFAVPNADPPPRPVVVASQTEAATGEPELMVELRIIAEPGVTRATIWRLRRTRTGTSDPARMPIVASGPMLADEPTAAGENPATQTATCRDDGRASIAPQARLAPWTRYTYVADLQGPPAPGSDIPGRWSRVSDPVTVMVIPPDPPAAVQITDQSGEAQEDGSVQPTLALAHPTAAVLSPGLMGPYRLLVERRRPGGELEVVAEHTLSAGLPAELDVGRADDEVVPFDTEYRLTLIDQLDRAAPVATVTIAAPAP